MSPLRLSGSTSGYSQLDAPAVAGDQTFTLPGTGGTLDRLNRAGNILQVVSTTKTDTFSTSALTTWTDITGLSASITPSSTSSKILVYSNVSGTLYQPGVIAVHLRLMRDSSAIAVGDAAGSRNRVSFGNVITSTDSIATATGSFLDSPATTASVTYKVQIWLSNTTATYINRTSNDADNGASQRSASTIVLMEVAA